MTEKEKLLQEVDKRVDKMPTKTEGSKTKTLLKSLAAWIMLFFAKDALAQEVVVQDPQTTDKEVVYQTPADLPDSTILLDDAVKSSGIETDSEWWDTDGEVAGEWQDKWKKESVEQWKEKKSPIEIHWSVRWGSDVTPLFWSVLSDRPALILTLDVSNPKTWLWASVIRADDFSKSMDNPASQVTLVDLYWQKKFWKVWVTAVWEFASIDKLPWAENITPLVWVTYDAWLWWTFDAWAWHTFQKWEDEDMIRLWVTKKLDETFSLAAQVFINSGLSKKVSGRVQANVTLGKWFWAQLSFIAKDGKITPTAWVIFKF